jgi:hypothetical protein
VTAHRNPGRAAESLDFELKHLSDTHRVIQADVTDAAGVAVLADASDEALGGLEVHDRSHHQYGRRHVTRWSECSGWVPPQ